MKKYKYNINNLDCANCALKLEEYLNKKEFLNNVIVNFNTSKLSFYSEKELSLKEINSLIKEVEPSSYVSEEELEIKKEYYLSILIIGVVIGIISYFIKVKEIKLIGYLISYSLLLYNVFIKALKFLIKSKTINENLLITISCLGALAIGKELEGIMVITLYTIGKILEEKAINNSRKSIKGLLDLKQPYANLKTNNGIKKVSVEEVKLNDLLIVKKGEKIPVDGIIIAGKTKIDTSFLTGESILEIKKENDQVLSGTLNIDDVITIKATQIYENSTVAKVLELLENATDKKAKTETIINKISKIYTPIVLIFAFLVIILWPILFDVSIIDAINRGLTFLVISCPCAIAISVPLSYFTAIGISSKNGILIKGSNYLDNLSNLKSIIFDKTGTLTNGSFTVKDIEIFDKNYTKEDIITILVKGESLSNHPISYAFTSLTNEVISSCDVKNYKEIEGKGITFTLNKKHISIGNKSLCNCLIDTSIHLNIDGSHVASISIDDGLKENAKGVISDLKKQGIKTYMFTGDKKEIALDIGNKLNIDEIEYEMLPTDKFNKYEQIASKNGITAMVGDGINDAPVLKRADIGISMGNIGSDIAIDASDIVLMKDNLTKINKAIDISLYTKYIIKQNLSFAILIKVVILILSMLGKVSMWLAVFADTGVTLLTIINTLRITKKFK